MVNQEESCQLSYRLKHSKLTLILAALVAVGLCCKRTVSLRPCVHFGQPVQWLCFMWDYTSSSVSVCATLQFVSEANITVPVFLPCVSSSQQYHSKQSIGKWLEDFVSNYPPYNRSHGSTRPDSWQTKHSVWVFRWQWKVSWMIHLAS